MLNSWSTLWIQIGVAVLLAIGAGFARLRWYRAHGTCQGAAYAVTLIATAFWMAPVFVKFFAPNLVSLSPDRTDVVATVHAALGTSVLLRTLLVLWWGVTALGIWTYFLSA